MIANGACSRLVASPHGIGWLDAERGELRTAHTVYIGVRFETRPATESEARAFFPARAATLLFLSRYYAESGDKGD